jgi:hypothetical protein
VLYPRAVDRTMWKHENGGDSVEAHLDRAVARTKMVVTVECLLLPVNWVNKETLPRLHSGKHQALHHEASGRVLFSDFLLNLFLRL